MQWRQGLSELGLMSTELATSSPVFLPYFSFRVSVAADKVPPAENPKAVKRSTKPTTEIAQGLAKTVSPRTKSAA